jgi:hypothetical protein
VTRCFALVIGFCAALSPALASAQANLDAGKSAAQIFAGACVECHKSPHGLAKGKSASAVADFLGEHYTTNRGQAAALAAYVLGGRGAEPTDGAAQGRGQKPATERATASTEEPKPAKRQPKPGAKPEQTAKPEDGKPANTKLRRPAPEEVKPKEQATGEEQPNIAAPETTPHGSRAATAARGRHNEPKVSEPPQEPAAVAHVPAATPAPPEAAPSQEASPAPTVAPSAAAAPADAASSDSGESAPVPRDNIPD